MARLKLGTGMVWPIQLWAKPGPTLCIIVLGHASSRVECLARGSLSPRRRRGGGDAAPYTAEVAIGELGRGLGRGELEGIQVCRGGGRGRHGVGQVGDHDALYHGASSGHEDFVANS